MENKNEIFNMPLASFTFGKDNQKMADIYSNPLFNEIKSPSDNINNLPIQSSLSQDYFQTGKYKKYNNTSGALKNVIDFNQNSIDNNTNYNNNFYNTNQSAKIVNANYGGEFTFGQNNEIKNVNEINIQNDNKNFFNSSLKNNYRNYNDINNNSLKNNPINYSQLTNINAINTIFRPIFFDENNNENNSYITVILHTIFNIKPLFNYILSVSQNNPNPPHDYHLIFCLKEIFQKVQKSPNDKINIRKLKESLSSLFKNRRKFILNHPDDPVDFLFILLNSIHSFIIKSPINEISDEICNYKCFSHKYLWMDLTRIDECGCNGTSRRLFSNHNYITDIPMNQIFNYINNNLQKNPKFNISEINQKLFFCYKDIIKNFSMNCPMNGTRCEINKTQHRLFLANSPSYFIFNLDYNESSINFSNDTLLIDILKCFILISKNFDINMIFEENSRNKNEYNINKKYNLFGIVFISLTKIYSCAFFHRGINNNSYFYYYKGNNNYVNFNSFYNLVLYSLKNGIIPLALFYEEKNNNEMNKRTQESSIESNNSNELLTKEQIMHLEKYCNNIDNLFNNINNNKIRTNENILNTMFTKQNKNSNNTLNNNKPSQSNNYKTNNSNRTLQSTKTIQNYITENNFQNNNSNENSLQNRNTNYKQNTYNNKSVQNHNLYINNNDNYYLQNNNTTNNSNEKLDDYSDKKYKKLKYETDVKHKANRMIKPNIEEYSSNLWEMPQPYLPYKKEEPIAILPLSKNQNSLDANIKTNKGNSENYFYKNKLIKDNYNTSTNNANNNINNNIDSIKKNELKQKSNSYSKKAGNNLKSLINSDINNNNINSDNVNDIKRRLINNINNMEHQITKTKISKNPNSFNKNHNLRNINDDNIRKYTIGKNNKSNFELSANNRPSNIPYNKNNISNNNTNNISNISSSNQNIKQISDEIIPSDDVKRRFKSKRLAHQVINYSSKSRKVRKNILNSEDDEMKSKSDDNMNNNIYNFNYIYNNNNFDMNILENNLDKNNIYNNYRITDDKYEKKKKIEKIKKNLNIKNISNYNNNSYLTENDKSIRTINDNPTGKRNQIGHWLCQYCSNMNRDDFIYCKICRRNKEGKILRINTQLLKINQKMRKTQGNKSGIPGNKKNEIPKNKKIMNNSNRINNKNAIKKLKRNTLIGFSSSKNFNIENYENFITNQTNNLKMKKYNNMDIIKKEYSFTKPSFNDKKN